MIELTYQDESPGDLRFHLVRGRVCPSRFTVVAEGVARCGETVVEARIIGASHAIVYDLAGMQFTEVLACNAPQSFGETLASGALEQIEQGVRQPLSEAVEYLIEARVLRGEEAWDQLAELESRVAEAPSSPRQAALRFTFPARTPGEVQAVTVVHAEVDGSGLAVETAHAYPQSDACVLTQTTIGPRNLWEYMTR